MDEVLVMCVTGLVLIAFGAYMYNKGYDDGVKEVEEYYETKDDS